MRRLSVSALCAALAACGGAAEEPVGPDAEALPAPGSSPLADARRVPVDAAVVLTFARPVDVASMQASLQAAGAPIPLSVTAEAPDTVVLAPDRALEPLTTHRLTLSAATAADGGALAEPWTLEFRTGGMARLMPEIGEVTQAPVDCDGAFALPEAFTGAMGLEAVGWTTADLVNQVAWNLPNTFRMGWISDDADSRASVRVRPELAPQAGHCFVRSVRAGEAEGPRGLVDVLTAQSAFSDPTTAYGGLSGAVYAAPDYDLGIDAPLVGAMWGLVELPNPWPGAPEVPAWTEARQAELQAVTEAWPMPVREALARLVLAVGEAHLMKAAALAGADAEVWAGLFDVLRDGRYGRTGTAFFDPVGGTYVADVVEHAPTFDPHALIRAAQGLGAAVEEVRAALAAHPGLAGELDVATPHGRIVIDLSAQDSLRQTGLEDVALLVDGGGNDRYAGQYAATSSFWMSASVLLDAGAGADFHNLRMADLANAGIRDRQAFDPAFMATQGAGVFGVGLLVDGGGPDVYAGSILTQGAGAFGVGALVDHGGDDEYRGTYLAQGLGYFGVGVLLDVSGTDRYVVGSHGQGVGRPGGHGLLLDGDGADTYLAIHVADPPELPDEHAFLFPSGYRSAEGREHNMSVAQGVGWGFRGDWFDPQRTWAGGMGALVDLGDGDDVHLGDCMVMGQGFVYGYGLLYDDGGDDRYRNFWWGLGSGTHMGVGVMIENGGDDDLFTTRASAGLGHDTGVAWYLDGGGDDRYGGQMTFGRSLQGGLSFFLELGGDDVYDTPPTRPNFGIVQQVPFSTLPRVGVFLDLGGGADTYPARDEVGNDRTWYQAPVGDGTDPDVQKGVGIDG